MKRTYKNGERLTKDESKFIYVENKCPDCNSQLLEGPCGGNSINVMCISCGAKFNIMSIIGIERITDNFTQCGQSQLSD